MVKNTDAGDGVSKKTPGERQREPPLYSSQEYGWSEMEAKNLPNGRTLTTNPFSCYSKRFKTESKKFKLN